ncbi:glycerol kinase GlpK [Nonomuraea helvata]|uniref:ATP:glycerol 3-phosphotransferase n=1 Tax=Nonomuraea helvata TaxID=37484 RepID=A0ABV5RZ15_9ACTN
MSVLAIDAGTTGVTALVVTDNGQIESMGYEEFRQHFPSPGWVEHNPEDIWQATLSACSAALSRASGSPACVGLTNQRETAVLWDRRTLAAPCRAIVWQDRRTAEMCGRLRDAGHEARVSELTGLRLDPYFTASKLAWLAEHEEGVWEGVETGNVAVGTVDSYLIARLTGGARHVTDPSNASRTLLYGLASGTWEPELCELFGVPEHALPEIVPNYGPIGFTEPSAFLGLELPISGVAGDQQAALFGQTCFDVGDVKCTYGTGSFVLANLGGEIVRSEEGLLTTVAWQTPSGERTFALEGSIFVTGAAVQWLRDGLGLIGTASESEALARTVPDSGGVVFVPALTGLGAPHWDPHARGLITGITRGTTRAHLVRATLEAIAFEVRDVVEAMTGGAVPVLKADGGASTNDLLMQLQADQLGAAVERPALQETTALGAAFLAGLGAGVWGSKSDLRKTWQLERRFVPGARDDAAYARWRAAVELASYHPSVTG